MSEGLLPPEQTPKRIDSVRLVVRSQQDPLRFLLVAEADDPENWKLPGGRFEEDETPEEAMVREAQEEGVGDIADGGHVELGNKDGVSRRHIFSATANEASISLDADPGEDPERIIGRRWVTREEVEASELKNREHILAAVDTIDARSQV